MRKSLIVAATLVLFCASALTYAQSTVGTLSGSVTDKGNARLPGVTVKVTNEDTGVTNSMLTNDEGIYSFILSPGSNYTLTAEYTGFKKAEFKKVTLRMADSQRVNITLSIGDLTQVVTVEADKDQLMKELNQSTGILLDEEQIRGLPLVGNDPLALVTTLPGYRPNPLGHEYDTVGGLPMYMMNTVRDGLSVTDGFFPGGVGSTTIMNPDMISEIRLILSPVDAEAGRGNGQVQITTRSGTNKLQWTINYNLRQNALNALGPSPNRIKAPFGATFQYIASVGGPIIKNRTFYFVNWDHQLSFSRPGSGQVAGNPNGFGGYIGTPVLTDPARNGIIRYFDGWNPQNSAFAEPTAGSTNAAGIAWPVWLDGTAVAPKFWNNTGPGSVNTGSPVGLPSAYTGTLMCYSVFGTTKFDGTPFDPTRDCGTYIPRKDDGLGKGINSWVPDFDNPQFGVGVLPVGRETWDGFGRVPDPTGYIQRLLSYMPRANEYGSNFTQGGGFSSIGADGLNRAMGTWVRGGNGLSNQNTFRGGTFGTGLSLDQQYVGHRIINLKIDHVIDSKSRITASTSIQDDQNSRREFQSTWPDGVDGYTARVPRVLTLNGLTTFSPTMVNEARFGISYNRSTQLPPWANPVNQEKADFARSWLQDGWISPNNGEVTPVYFRPGVGIFDFSSNILPGTANTGFSNTGNNADNAQCTGENPVNCETAAVLYNMADTFSWNYKSHSIRGGGEFRLTRTREDSAQIYPTATPGFSQDTASQLGVTLAELPSIADNVLAGVHGGRSTTMATNSANLLYLLSGSVASVQQTYWVNSIENFKQGTWETWDIAEGRKGRRSVQNEYALFVKDDWKIGSRLTLNLGLRYENYGNLYTRGFATGILDEGLGLFGPARMRGPNPFDYWLTPGNLHYTGYGRIAPAIDVRGMFLPDGTPSYIPGNCTPATQPAAGCEAVPGSTVSTTAPGGPGVQQVSGGVAGARTAMTNCVYGITQSPLLPTSNCDPTLLTTRIFVGPGSDHPEQAPLYRDANNFGPAIGFSYRLPLGDRTVLIRGGFQFTFGSAGRDRSIGSGSNGQLSQQNGGTELSLSLDQANGTCNSGFTCLGLDPTAPAYPLSLRDLPNLVPPYPTAMPSIGGNAGNIAGERVLLVQNFGVGRVLSATGYAPGYQGPRTENYTLSVSTNLTRTSSISMSYVGTLGRNRPTGVNLNMNNVYYNPELLDWLTRTRAGENVPELDAIFAGLNLVGNVAGYGSIGTCLTPTAAQVALANAAPQSAYAPYAGANFTCPGRTIYQSGSAHLRNASNTSTFFFAQNLANGNFAGVAATLASNSTLPGGTTNPTGWRNTTFGIFNLTNVLRNGCDRLGTANATNNLQVISGSLTAGNPNPVRCLPEDWLSINPGGAPGSASGQVIFGTQGTGLIWKDNWGYTNYHQFQVQYTMRASFANFQATYLTSKTLALPRDFYKTNNLFNNPGSGTSFGAVTGFSDPKNEQTRARDYGESSDSLKHSVRMNGVFQLPIGPGRPLLNNANKWVGRILGGWQMGIIYNVQSGQPFSIVAGDMMFGASTSNSQNCNAYSGVTGDTLFCSSGLVFPDVVSPLWSTPKGKTERNGPGGSTTYFGNPSPFALITDPQCNTPANGGMVGRHPVSDLGKTVLNTGSGVFTCDLRALVMKVAPGTPGAFPLSATDPTPVLIMLQNPLPGHQGSLGAGTMKQPGRFYLDANLAKRFMFTESRGIEFRVDATNVLNHPTPADMFFNLGPGGTFNDQSTSALSALSSQARQVQVGVRMLNN